MNLSDKATLENYIANNPDTFLLPLLATQYLMEKNAAAAMELCRKDLALHPQSATAHYIWAEAALLDSHTGSALEHLQAAVQLDAFFLQAYYRLLEIGRSTLSPYSQKRCLERIVRLNPFDQQAVTQLNNLPADLPYTPDKPYEAAPPMPVEPPPPLPEPAVIPPVAPKTPPKAEPVVEGDNRKDLEKFFQSMAQSGPVSRPPVETFEEETHFGPLEPDLEPDLSNLEPPVQSIPEPSAAPAPQPSKISDLFAKLRSQPLDEVQKENWAMDLTSLQEPAPAAVEPTGEDPLQKIMASLPSQPPESAPSSELPADLMEAPSPAPDQLAETVRSEPAETIPEPEMPALVSPIKPEPAPEPINIAPESSPATAEEPTPPSATAPVEKPTPPRRKKTTRKSTTKSAEGINSVTFPIPTWTLVDVLKKQRLYDQAISLLDLLEKKSKGGKELEKIHKTRAEIGRLQADEEPESAPNPPSD